MHTLMASMALKDGRPWLVFGTMGGNVSGRHGREERRGSAIPSWRCRGRSTCTSSLRRRRDRFRRIGQRARRAAVGGSARSVPSSKPAAHYGEINSCPPALKYCHSGAFALPGGTDNWPFMAELTDDRTISVARGKAVGGSSAVNGAFYGRGVPADDG